jgi:predicted dehydrogenase
MTSRVRVGVAGVGHWASTAHMPAIRAHPLADLVAIADPYEENLERARRAFDVPSAFADPLEMLATSALDAVVVATPHAFHHVIALQAIRGGSHVLVEKPFVLDPAHGHELIEAAAAHGVEIIVGYPWHYNEQSLLARRWMADGRLGTLTFVESFFGSSPVDLYRGRPEAYPEYGQGASFFGPRPDTYSEPRLAGGGQGQTQMTHSLALLLFLTGLVPSRVAAFMGSLDTPVDVIDTFAIRFEGGALGSASSTGAVTPLEHTELLEYRIHGSRGHLQFDVMEGRLSCWTADGSTDAPGLPTRDRYPYLSPATNLIDVAAGCAENGSDARVAQLTVELLDAAYRSARSDGTPVDVGARGSRMRTVRRHEQEVHR